MPTLLTSGFVLTPVQTFVPVSVPAVQLRCPRFVPAAITEYTQAPGLAYIPASV